MEPKEIIFTKDHLVETASTNTYLQQLDTDRHLPEGHIVYTDTQRAGRGQRGNSWESEPGKNLTFSLLLRPEHIPANQQFLLSQAVSLAMTDLLGRVGFREAQARTLTFGICSLYTGIKS